MSDERLRELGLPRREFLKRAAVGAFAAPLIVSFGLAGTAEAAPTCFPNQTFANQTSSLYHELSNTTFYIWEATQESLVDPSFASRLYGLYLITAQTVLNNRPKEFCYQLGNLRTQITQNSGRRIDPGYASDLLSQINSLVSAYCNCT